MGASEIDFLHRWADRPEVDSTVDWQDLSDIQFLKIEHLPLAEKFDRGKFRNLEDSSMMEEKLDVTNDSDIAQAKALFYLQ